jgi:hypothetical protein
MTGLAGVYDDLTHLVIMLATFATVWRLFVYEATPAMPTVASTA